MSFRARVMLMAIGMGLVMSLVFAAAAIFITERYEHVLVGALLQDQANAWAERLAEDPQARLPSSELQRAYLRRPGETTPLPAHLTGLTPGVHEGHSSSDDGLHVGVFDTPAGRIYLEIDLREIEALERYLLHILFIVIFAGALLSSLLGWWLARSATRPLRRLAGEVERLDTAPHITDLAAHQPRDELGRVALAIDSYQRRLVEAEQVERTFFADASHELRTPVAVVRGALELLEEDVQSEPHLQAPMQRLRRGVDEVSTLLDALLRLARRQLATLETVDVDSWMQQQIEIATQGQPNLVNVRLEGHAGTLPLPLRDAELVVSALLRSMLAKRPLHTLLVTISPQGIFFSAQGDALSTSDPTAPRAATRSDSRFGNSLIGRLAIAHGWRIDLIDDAAISIRWVDDVNL
ncbi:MAG: HAMP domain-containing protein [Xanthomonadaceae bacterium]|nr:HAMP domain-containing protein [Xanthomonadaceae bacterium]